LRTGGGVADGAAVFLVLILFGVVDWAYPLSIKGASRNPTRRLSNYLAAFVFVVSLPRRFFYVGSRPDSRGTFLCLAKEKYPKEMPPGFRLFPALLAFGEGFRRAIPGPAKTSGLLPLPYRAYFAKSCDARGGITGMLNSNGYCVKQRLFGSLG
jgi:hypothetical protein